MLGIAKRNAFFRKLDIRKSEVGFQKDFKIRRLYLTAKRGFDLLFSLLVIVLVLSWLFPILALLIKLDSAGPVFFLQIRVGFLGKTFRCFKFRTMIVNSSSDEKQAVPDDPRITRIGKFLRVTSLDELPQFVNVLLGDMSIVGPRPHMHKDNEEFGKLVTDYCLRYCVKPGITGMAQVKGCRGPIKNFQGIFHRCQWDAFYVRNANISLDFKIIRLTASQTLKSIFSFKGTNTIAEEPLFMPDGAGLVLAKTNSSEQ